MTLAVRLVNLDKVRHLSYSSEMANKKYPRTATVSLTKEDWKIIDELKRKLSLAEAPMSTTGIVKHSIRKAAGLK